MSEQPTGSLLLELDVLLNRYSREQASNTPDFILAEFMFRSLEAFEWACRRREMWYGRALTPGGVRLDWAGTTGTSVSPEVGTVSIDNGKRFPVTPLCRHGYPPGRCLKDASCDGPPAPCGGTRCIWTDGGWLHSSKSYGSCSAARQTTNKPEVKP